ncbi:uncharacterized protein Bfra_010302 [Botrytis fragariae]|uniref:Uncharacterized protein n=1 Tax=Botrytis fragariae TaxID=1964551 RepID=A0A8H6AMN1_9HELO|nr:uncharacterized protein Bfra_010302 [Botrytis fragariae]KAF5870156.1 hypothetical protein Bfra_010302 [Botrytis fragariae]
MFNKKLFHRKDNESRKKRDGRDDQREAPRGGSRASSRDNRNIPRSDMTSNYREHMRYLKPVLKRFAVMPGLSKDAGILLQKVLDLFKMLRENNESLFGHSKIGGDCVKEIEKNLANSQKIQRRIDKYIKNEEKKLREEGPMQKEGNIKAFEEGFKEVHKCSPETWEVRRIIEKNTDDLGLIIAEYDELLISENCIEDDYNKQVVEKLISRSSKLKAKHEEALSILAKDDPQTQSRESRSDTRVPRPNNTRNYTGHAR